MARHPAVVDLAVYEFEDDSHAPSLRVASQVAAVLDVVLDLDVPQWADLTAGLPFQFRVRGF